MDRKCLSPLTKRRYAQISIKRRESFVSCIIDKGISLAKAAKRFNIKLSTAKLIFKKFKETGRFFPKKLSKNASRQLMDPTSSENPQENGRNHSQEPSSEIEQEKLEPHQDQLQHPQRQSQEQSQILYYFPCWLYEFPYISVDFYNC